MPLKGYIDGNPIISSLLTDDEWKNLNSDIKSGKKQIKFDCCENTGHLRVSKLGTKHFVHNRRDNCNWKPESLEHLQLKAELLRICSQLRWSVDTEVMGDDWIADVITWNNERKIVFEIQLSYQTLEKTKERTSKYLENGFECYWLVKKLPAISNFQERFKKGPNVFQLLTDSQNNYDVAIYQLPEYSNDDFEETSSSIDITEVTKPVSEKHFGIKYGKSMKLPDFVGGILGKTLQYCVSGKGTNKSLCYRIVFFPISCWKCGKISHAYYIDSIDFFESDCGIIAYEQESDENVAFHPQILEYIRKYLSQENNENQVILGEINKRYSKTVRHEYMSFGCAHCDALFGDFFIGEDTCSVMTGEIEPTLVIPINILIENEPELEIDTFPHWCQSAEKKFCDNFNFQ
jgi:competence protein CoiA